MELDGKLFSLAFLSIVGSISLVGAVLAAKIAPWRRLANKEQLHVFFGSCVALMVLWTLRTEVFQGIEFHLIILTTLTLMFGWSLAVLGGLIALLGVTLAGFATWSGFALNVLTVVLLPVSFSQLALLLVRYWFPKHFFIYIYINAFLAGGIAVVLSSVLASVLMAISGMASFSLLWETYLTYFPLMFFPEAVLNGWFMSLLVAYKPQWVSTFRDEEYLQGK